MGSPEIRVVDDEEWEGGERKKHRSRKPGNGEEGEGLDGGGRRRGYGDSNRIESRKRSSGSSRADSDDNGYDSRKEFRSKQMKKRQEESTLEKLSSWYEDGELENRQDGGDKSGSKVRGSRTDEGGERRKMSSKQVEHDGSQGRSRSKEDRLHDRELEKMDKDSRYSEKKESNRQKVHGSSEQVKSSRRRWDEADTVKNIEDSCSEKGDHRSAKASSDTKHQSSRDRSGSGRSELGESKSRGLDSVREKVVKSIDKEDKIVDFERGKSKGRPEPQDISYEDNILDKDRIEKPRRLHKCFHLHQYLIRLPSPPHRKTPLQLRATTLPSMHRGFITHVPLH